MTANCSPALRGAPQSGEGLKQRSTKIVESKDLSPPLFIEEVAAGRRSPKTPALVVPTSTTNAFLYNNTNVGTDRRVCPLNAKDAGDRKSNAKPGEHTGSPLQT